MKLDGMLSAFEVNSFVKVVEVPYRPSNDNLGRKSVGKAMGKGTDKGLSKKTKFTK